MEATVLEGAVSDQMILQIDRVIDMKDEVKYLDADSTQLYSFLSQVGRGEKAKSTKFHWQERQYMPNLSKIGVGGITNVATVIPTTAGQGQYFRPGDFVRILSTGEGVLVQSVAVDNLTVERGIGGVAAAAALAGATLYNVGNATAQGVGLGVMKVLKNLSNWNYAQIFRHPFGFTNSEIASENFSGNQLVRERKDKFVEHKRAMDSTAIFGARAEDLTNPNNPLYMTGGATEFITTNVIDLDGAMTDESLEAGLTQILANGGKKMIIATPGFTGKISGWQRDKVGSLNPNEKLWGATVDMVYSGALGVKIPIFTRRDWYGFKDDPTYSNFALVVDLNNVDRRPLRETVLAPKRQDNDIDGVYEEYITEVGFEWSVEESHGLLINA